MSKSRLQLVSARDQQMGTQHLSTGSLSDTQGKKLGTCLTSHKMDGRDGGGGVAYLITFSPVIRRLATDVGNQGSIPPTLSEGKKDLSRDFPPLRRVL